MKKIDIYGFTLIEILISLTIFMLGSIGIISLINKAISLHRISLEKYNITLLADSILAELKNTDIIYGYKLKNIYKKRSKVFPKYLYDIEFIYKKFFVIVKLKIYYKAYGKLKEYKFNSIIFQRYLFKFKKNYHKKGN